MDQKENYIGFWAACMLLLAALFGLTMGIASFIGIAMLSWTVLKLMVLEMVLVMGTGIFLVDRRRKYKRSH